MGRNGSNANASENDNGHAVSFDLGREGGERHSDVDGPQFGGRSRVDTSQRRPETISDELAALVDHNSAKPCSTKLGPSARKHATVSVPRGVGEVALGHERVQHPLEGTLRSERQGRVAQCEKAAVLQQVIAVGAEAL